MGEAVSTWMVINVKTRRPQEVDIVKEHLHLINDKKALGYFPDKMDVPEDASEIFVEQVRYFDIDFHQHVNNNRYMEWAINALPFNKIRETTVQSFQINFMSEALLNDQISIEYSQADEVVQGIRLKDGKPIFRIKFYFN